MVRKIEELPTQLDAVILDNVESLGNRDIEDLPPIVIEDVEVSPASGVQLTVGGED